MFFTRILLVIIAFFAIVVALRMFRRRQIRADPRKTSAIMPPEKMVACARCGTYVPLSEAVTVRGSYFCTNAHAEPGA